jgi:hypothetical protein
MSFVDHGSLGKKFPVTPTNPTSTIWTEDRMRHELRARGVWPSSLPGNVEHWYPAVLSHVHSCDFTFEQFADELAEHQPFDFGRTLKRLLAPPTQPIGWQDGILY